VIEVDVGQEDGPRPLVAKRLQHRGQRRLRPGIDQDPVHLPAADHMGPPQVHHVDQAHGRQHISGKKEPGDPPMRQGAQTFNKLKCS